MSVPYTGSKISLVSNSEIRYEGILYTINTAESTIALQSVRCFGTEGRKIPEIPASSEVYDFIIFRGQDIKDLNVLESCSAVNDPAIVSINQKPSPAKGAGAAGKGGAATTVPVRGGYDTSADKGGKGRDTRGTQGSWNATNAWGGAAAASGYGAGASWNAWGSAKGAGTAARNDYTSGYGGTYGSSAGYGTAWGTTGTGKGATVSKGSSKGYGTTKGTGKAETSKGGKKGSTDTKGGKATSTGKGKDTGKTAKGGKESGSKGKGDGKKGGDKGTGKNRSGARTANANTSVLVGELQPEENAEVKKELAEDFDVAAANKKFDKVSGVEDTDGLEDRLKPLAGYDKAKSFFDSISCEATERPAESERPKIDREKAREFDKETFGDTRRPPRPAGGRPGKGRRRGAEGNA